jgi:nucleoside-diphosphate-sugar epimerase
VFSGVDRARLTVIELDVSDQCRLHDIFAQYEISRVAHLAALQTPDCNALRDLGLQINLAGTQKILEAVKASGRALARFVFASSIAVYGDRASYPQERVPMMAPPKPVNVYGTWKLASEQICEFFCQETRIPTVCLRPGVLFGPGRDAGLTSTPTTAMKCVALGLPYTIPYQNRQDYLYAPDVGNAFGNALMRPFAGYGVFTLPARTAEMQDFVAAMRQAAEDVGRAGQFRISGTLVPSSISLPFPPRIVSDPI